MTNLPESANGSILTVAQAADLGRDTWADAAASLTQANHRASGELHGG